MIYDDFRVPGWPSERWAEYRLPHLDLWDPTATVRMPGAPENTLTLEVTRYSRSHPNHVKAMVMASKVFDLTQSKGFVVRAEVAVETFGTGANPHGLPAGDPRLAAGALVLIDPTTGMVFDFFISNDRIEPLYERLPVARDTLGPYPAFTRLLDPIASKPGQWHKYETHYDRVADHVEWWIDGQRVAQLDRAGAPIGSPAPVVKWNSLRIGGGLFTLLDPLRDDRETADDNPPIPGFIATNLEDRFGQGAKISFRSLDVET